MTQSHLTPTLLLLSYLFILLPAAVLFSLSLSLSLSVTKCSLLHSEMFHDFKPG